MRGEVVVSDNGSTDGSIDIAREHGARVVHATVKGYGHALRKGIEEARGTFLVMGDADDSYDFAELPRFVIEELPPASTICHCSPRQPKPNRRPIPCSRRSTGSIPTASVRARRWGNSTSSSD